MYLHVSIMQCRRYKNIGRYVTKSVHIIKRKISNEIQNYQYCFNFKTTLFMCKAKMRGNLYVCEVFQFCL